MPYFEGPLPVVIGYDTREPVTFHVLAHSILRRASRPVTILPLALSTLADAFDRPRDPKQSTDFAFSRFLTPWLTKAMMDYSIFMDSDMLCLCDVWDLVDHALEQPGADVLVRKHDYVPKAGNKFLDQKQSVYPCKNWSSLMVFRNWRSAVKTLTPSYVNTASGADLHQFKWAREIGELDNKYNHLVGEYKPMPSAKIIHYTLGAPCFRGYHNCEFSQEWFEELGHMTACADPAGSMYADLSRGATEGIN